MNYNTKNIFKMEKMELGADVKNNEEIELKKEENKIENKIEENLPEENELKSCYSLDEISYSKLENEDEISLPLKKKKKIYEISQLILADNVEELKKILEEKKSLIKKKTLEGFSFIQYAALNGALNCFIYLLSLKVPTDEDIEGFYLIHLSLMKSVFNEYKLKCIQTFKYIYLNLPEQRKYKDRLGRIYLHLIFEYNLFEIFINNDIIIGTEDLFMEDNNGDYAINYIYIYDSYDCYLYLMNNQENMTNMYFIIKNEFKNNKYMNLTGENKFLENLFIYKRFFIIFLIIHNCAYFKEILYQDLSSIYSKYFMLRNENKDNSDNNEIDENKINPIDQLLKYIEYFINILNSDNGSKFFNVINYQKTAILFNQNCINHIKLPDNDPFIHFKKKQNMFENSDRLSCLIDENEGIIVKNNAFIIIDDNNENNMNSKFIIHQTERQSCLNDILKCHDIKYIKALKYKSDNIKKSKIKNSEQNSQPKFWDNINLDLIEKNYFLYNDNNDTTNTDNNINEEEEVSKNINNLKDKNDLHFYQKIDIDTFINQYSYQNIYNTTGCVFDAIDIVMNGHSSNAFVIIRPPGHHAGYYGPVENEYETSNGFCLVNNVPIGAAYVKYNYPSKIKKVAIVDIDVHHGNGTEEIVQMLNYKNFSKPFNYEKICGVKLNDKRTINWYDFDDSKNILFISTHIYNKSQPDKFYPYSGSEESNTSKDSDIYPGGIYNIPFDCKKNYPYEYRHILRSKIIPRLYKFKPDIIFISAGFDGHKLEKINEQNMLLTENDYAYIAQQIQYVANKFCEGRVIAVLEGGYNTNTGVISPFAQSIYKFIRHMNIGLNQMQCTDVKISGQKRKELFEEEMNLFKSYYQSDKEDFNDDNKPRRSERLKYLRETEKKNIENENNEIKDEINIDNNVEENINKEVKEDIEMEKKEEIIKNEEKKEDIIAEENKDEKGKEKGNEESNKEKINNEEIKENKDINNEVNNEINNDLNKEQIIENKEEENNNKEQKNENKEKVEEVNNEQKNEEVKKEDKKDNKIEIKDEQNNNE